MAYQAIIARIHTREIPGSDNIVLGNCLGYNVIVQKETPQGALGVFFEQGGQLSEEFCQVHDLVRRKDENGNSAGGYFEENRRVKAVKMRGCKSEGFWVPLDHLAYAGVDVLTLKEGDQFADLGGHKICQKYFTPATRRARGAAGPRQNRGETAMFAKHIETEAFRRGVGMIPKGAIIYLSEKLHGTSFRYGLVLEDVRPQGLLEKVIHWLTERLKFPLDWREWTYLNGSRNVILERRKDGEQGYYGAEAFRLRATQDVALHKGEVLFGELVGYTETGQPIMSPQDAKGLKDKKAQKAFGDRIVYRYGCREGQTDLYIYRITQVNEDGVSFDLSWPQVVARCRELALKPVPTFGAFIYDGDAETLSRQIALLVDGEGGSDAIPSGVDPGHPQEGIVLRYESEWGLGWLKHKSFVFGILEGYLKEKDDYVDTEEVA